MQIDTAQANYKEIITCLKTQVQHLEETRLSELNTEKQAG